MKNPRSVCTGGGFWNRFLLLFLSGPRCVSGYAYYYQAYDERDRNGLHCRMGSGAGNVEVAIHGRCVACANGKIEGLLSRRLAKIRKRFFFASPIIKKTPDGDLR